MRVLSVILVTGLFIIYAYAINGVVSLHSGHQQRMESRHCVLPPLSKCIVLLLMEKSSGFWTTEIAQLFAGPKRQFFCLFCLFRCSTFSVNSLPQPFRFFPLSDSAAFSNRCAHCCVTCVCLCIRSGDDHYDGMGRNGYVKCGRNNYQTLHPKSLKWLNEQM